MRRRLLRLAPGFVLFIVLLGGGGYFWLRSSLPVDTGTLALPGLREPVRITRDAHGIPTIRANNEHDADFALGFLHAQDRLFAMDMMRRYGAGRLSEVYGARTVAIDRAMRTLGLYRAAEQQLAGLSPPVRAALDAYAAGVNAFLSTRRGALPPEYYVLNARPERWRPADSLVWGKIMDLELTGNYRGELLRAEMLRQVSPADLAILFPPRSGNAPLPMGKAALYRGLPLRRLAVLLPAQAGPQRASNDWVLSGAHTLSGKPLLANDPHLDFSAPGIWYLVRIETPDETLAGVTAPGTPFLIIGHNTHIAWGFTTTGSDVEDLFVEKPDPADPGRYLIPGGSAPFITRQETIKVRGGAPVTLTLRATRHGPVISDLLPRQEGGELLALQTSWLGADDRSPDAVWGMSRAHDWAGFTAALHNWVAPQQNIVYADVDGNIGFIAPARVPIRAKGDGWLPEPGWTGEYDWTGTIPFAALPSAYNPPSGRIVTANNKIVPDDYPYFLTRDWGPPERAERIAALLDRAPKQSPATTAAIQGDIVSLDARTLVPLLLKMTPSTPSRAPALARLRGWDGRMAADRPEPLVYTAWLRELDRVLLADRLGPSFRAYWNLHPDVAALILTQHQAWCATPGETPARTCAAALGTALDKALAELAAHFGPDLDSWRWGRAHEAVFASPVWSQIPLLRDWVRLAVPAGGGDDTVDAGVMAVGAPDAPFLDRHGPTLRMIVDMAEPSAARFMITPGQSGNPLSSHWGDLMQPWHDVLSVALGQDAGGGVLTLEPQ